MKATVKIEKDGELHIVLLTNVRDKSDAVAQAEDLSRVDKTSKKTVTVNVTIQEEVKD